MDLDERNNQTSISRRDFLKLIGTGAAALAIAGCDNQQIQTQISAKPTVAIARATDYDRASLQKQITELLDNIGGLDDIIRPGDSVALKVNLTGGTYYQPFPGVDPIESYVTHPEVARVLGERLLDASAGEIFIIEAQSDLDSFDRWGYVEVADALGATLVDLNNPDPYDDFAEIPVGDGWLIYKHLLLNQLLKEVDVFVSVSKMKCHYSVGVTHTMKNLVGLTPVQHYRTSPEHFWRSALHGDEDGHKRLARVIMDLNRARPVHLGLVDGIKAAEGGEVPRGSFKPVKPGLMIAGKNAVATDAVATALMGFDPSIEYPNAPFLHGENYLNLASDLALGTNKLDDIEVVGAVLDDVRFQFAPSTEQSFDNHTIRVM